MIRKSVKRFPEKIVPKQSAMMIDPTSSRLEKRGIQVPESSTFHSFWKTWPEVSLASARNVLAPFDT
jgi:hypothetical protein